MIANATLLHPIELHAIESPAPGLRLTRLVTVFLALFLVGIGLG